MQEKFKIKTTVLLLLMSIGNFKLRPCEKNDSKISLLGSVAIVACGILHEDHQVG